jgi:hypothetical protein
MPLLVLSPSRLGVIHVTAGTWRHGMFHLTFLPSLDDPSLCVLHITYK